MDAQQLADILRTARVQRGFSQRDLAVLVDMPQSHLSKIEAGAVDLRVSTLAKLADALGLGLRVTAEPEVPAATNPDTKARANPALTDMAQQLDALMHQRPQDADLLRDMQTAVEVLAGTGAHPDPAHIRLIKATMQAHARDGDAKHLQAARKLLARMANHSRTRHEQGS